MFDFQFKGWLTPRINNMITKGAKERIKDTEFIKREVEKFINCPKRWDMITGNEYYFGNHDILKRKRYAIGEWGKLEEVENLPNARLINNQYRRLVDQKVNYLLGKEIGIRCENENYGRKLKTNVFNSKFHRLMIEMGEDSLNCGIGWVYVYYNNEGNIEFKRIKPWQIIPGWSDEEHSSLDYALRVYNVRVYEGRSEKNVTKIEVFEKRGISKFVLDKGKIIPDGTNWQEPYFYADNRAMGFEKIPLIPFRYGRNEIPLIKRVKSLQDSLNIMISEFDNGMEENPRNTILVIKNYDGEDLGEFRRNLSAYSAVKVSDEGGIETLNVSVNCENYKTIIDILKKAIVENAMGYDSREERFSANPNQMNIKSMYSDIDLEADKMEAEFKEALYKLLWFVNISFKQGGRDYDENKVEFVFNRNIMINESEAIDNCIKSREIISNESIAARHPWVSDVGEEMKKLKKVNES